METISNVDELYVWHKKLKLCGIVDCSGIRCDDCFADGFRPITKHKPEMLKASLVQLKERAPEVFENVNLEPLKDNLSRMILLGETDYSRYWGDK